MPGNSFLRVPVSVRHAAIGESNQELAKRNLCIFANLAKSIGTVRCIIIPIDGDCALGFRCIEFTSCSMADE